MSAIRLHPDLNKLVETQIESYLSQALNSQADIGSLEISRSNPFSGLVAEEVTFISEYSHESWGLDRIEISMDVLSSLLNRQIKIKQVVLVGLDLMIHRDVDGVITVNKEFSISPQSDQGAQDLSSIRLNLVNAKIHLKDDVKNVSYHFSKVSAHIKPGLLATDFYLKGELPQELGEKFILQASVVGNLSEFSEAKVKFYIQAEKMNFKELQVHLPQQQALDIDAVFDVEAWGGFDRGSVESLQGSLHVTHEIADTHTHNQQLCMSNQLVEGIAFDYELRKLSDEWVFLANNLMLFNDDHDQVNDINPKQLGLKVAWRHDRPTSLSLYVSEIQLGSLCNIINEYNPEWLAHHLIDYRADTSIKNLQVHWENDQGSHRYQYAAQFFELNFLEVNTNRKIEGLTGSLQGGDAGGVLTLSSDQVRVSLPQLYPEKDLVVSAQGDWTWQYDENQYLFQTDLLHLQNYHLDANLRIAGFIQSGELYVDSQIFIRDFDATYMGGYFPAIEQVERSKQWFTSAIKKGSVRNSVIQLRGKLSDFPFNNDTGVFSAEVSTYDTDLEYLQGWPQFNDIQALITMDKDRVEVIPQTASMFDSTLLQAKLIIPSYLQAVLYGHGVLEGDGQDLIYFLADSGLVEPHNSVVDQISLQGNTQVELTFTKSLTNTLPLPFEISGEIGFDGNTLNIHAAQLALEQLNGRVSFDQRGAYADQLSAFLYQEPINFTMRALGDGASELLFRGGVDVDEYLQQHYPQFIGFFSGRTDMHGKLYLPSMFKKNNPEKILLDVQSLLKGIKFDLPYPLNKRARTQLSSSFTFNQKDQSMRWRIADKAALLFTAGEQQSIDLSVIEIGSTKKNPPPQIEYEGLLLTGEVDRFPVSEWMSFYDRYLIQSAQLKTSSYQTQTSLLDIQSLPRLDLKIDQVEWRPWPTQNVRLKAHHENQEYHINLKSSLGNGDVRLPLNGDLPIEFDMQKFVVPKRDKPSSEIINPRSLPAFVFEADEFMVRNKSLRNVLVQGDRIHDGLLFSKIGFGLVDLDAQGNGYWRQMNDGSIWSQFDIDMHTSDLADALESLGFESGLRNGSGNIKAQLTWPDAPHKINLAQVVGNGSMDINNGSVVEVEPGAARLLALFNLSAIARRLSLDFKDVTTKGFAFNKIHGNLNLHSGGDVYTDKIIVDSSAAVIELSGTTNIVEQSYDQKVSVTPSVTESLPAAGALVGGPIGAAAGFVFDKVAKVVGLNKALTYYYSMTGTWEKPIIKKEVKVSDEVD